MKRKEQQWQPHWWPAMGCWYTKSKSARVWNSGRSSSATRKPSPWSTRRWSAAVRDAANATEFEQPVGELAGSPLEIVSGEEEARLSFLGATRGLDAPPPFLVLDIGGGSTEFVVGSERPSAAISTQMGSVRLTERFVPSDPPEASELDRMRAAIGERLDDVERAMPARDAHTFVAVAGTSTTVQAVSLGLDFYDPDRVHPTRLPREDAARGPPRQFLSPAATTRVADALDRRPAPPGRAVPVVMEDQARAVIDHPELPVPDEKIRVFHRAIDVGDERIEPDDRRRETRVAADLRVDERIERDRAGEVVEREVEPLALPQQILNLRIALGHRHPRVEIDEDDLGNRESENARDLPGDELRDERFRALSGAAELQHVRAAVVARDDRGQRSAFAQRRDVLRGCDRSDHRC